MNVQDSNDNNEVKTAGNVQDKKRAQKRGIIIAFSVMIAIILIRYIGVPAMGQLITYLESHKSNYSSDYMDRIKSLSFYPADYDEDIFTDEEYMAQNRYISYTKGMNTFTITDDDYDAYDPTVGFFADYFNTVINGDYENYNSYFSEEYFKNQSNKERFTPQKLYDIEIKNKSTTINEEDGSTSYIYYVDYKIMKNNGTFRNDMESDSIRTLVYQLIMSDDGEILINYIGR